MAIVGRGVTGGADIEVLVDSGTDGDMQLVKLAYSATGDETPVGADANGLDVDVTRVVPGTTASSLGKAEDAAAGSGDTGVMALAVRKDTAGADAGDGDYVALHVDSSGRLQVSGTQIEDAVAGSGDPGTFMLAIRRDTPAADGADGDYVGLHTDSSGRLQTVSSFSSGVLIPSSPVSSAGLTTASTAYTSGDVLGTGWTIPNAASSSGGTGRVIGITLLDYADIVTSVILYFFQGAVTFGTDNVAPSISDADSLKFVGTQPLNMLDMGSVRASSVDSIALPYVLDGTDLLVYTTTTVGHTFFGAVTDLRLRVSVARD